MTVFLKEFFEKVVFEKNQQIPKKHEKFTKGQRVEGRFPGTPLLPPRQLSDYLFEVECRQSLATVNKIRPLTCQSFYR